MSECVSRYSFIEHRTKEFGNETISAIFVELERFTKPLEECETLLDKWCYSFRHIGRLKSRPSELAQEVFAKLFGSAEIARFDKDKRLKYENEMYTERDKYAEEEYMKEVSFTKGRAEGEQKKALEIAARMKTNGFTAEQICEITDLPLDEIAKL